MPSIRVLRGWLRIALFSAVLALGSYFVIAAPAQAQPPLAVTSAASPTPTALLACENNKSHAISFPDVGKSCKKGQTAIVLDGPGPQGPPGPASTTIVPTASQVCDCYCTAPPCDYNSPNAEVVSQCPDGEVVVGGTYTFDFDEYYNNAFGCGAVRLAGFPTSSGDGWVMSDSCFEADSPCTEQLCYSATVYAICVQGSATVLPTVEATPSVSYDGDSASSPKKK
ncbi:hypothetical protein [Candidatus Binatus sp.]|jgi:hypothetical protein|uniref:hypothetical protein n=1 Tax=Candidatus Binatus sp. TaxID=2811406 RepID=UPI003C3C8A86